MLKLKKKDKNNKKKEKIKCFNLYMVNYFKNK